MQNLDTQLQRTLNMDNFDTAQEIRRRRKEIDEVVAEQLVSTPLATGGGVQHCTAGLHCVVGVHRLCFGN